MKFSKLFVSALAFSLPHVFSEDPCVTGAFTFSFDGECNYESALEAYLDVFNDYMNRSSDCSRTAEEDFLLLLNAGDSSEGEDKVHAICGEAFDNAIEIPFKNIAMQTRDYEFERRFYNGDTRWNEETETLYTYGKINGRTNVLRNDAKNVKTFYDNFAQNVHVEWPDQLSNFKTCTTNAAMCCWPRDRQANDNNGNCGSPYDSKCYDKNPGDNTDLCFVDLAKGDTSTDFGSSGTIVFPNDNDDGEGAIHCHGFAWGNDPNDFTNRYKANNLFFVSMYDHMHQRGYVENIPGAPMCACVEQMPVVTRSDCTQIDVDESFKFTYDGTSFTAELTDIEIDFNACQGVNNQNNNLWAYMGRLYREGKVTSDQYAALDKVLVKEKNCPFALDHYYATKGYVPAHNKDPTVWTQVAGKGVFDFAFEEKGRLQADALFKASENKIIHRICRNCIQSHKHIYYRHVHDISADRFIVNYLKNGVNREDDNAYGFDFLLYSSYQDALAQTNGWDCDYQISKPFPGRCAPSGSVSGQGATFFPSSGQHDVAFFVEKSSTTEMTKLENSLDIGNASNRPGSAVQDGNTIYMTGSGTKVWDNKDDCHYLYEQKTGDVDMVVKVNRFDHVDSWSKAGLMIRENLGASSKQLMMVNSGNYGPRLQARPVEGLGMWSKGSNGPGAPIWLKLTKRGSSFTAYTSENGEDWKWFESCVLNFDANFYVGLVVSAGKYGYLAEAEFFQYNTESFYYPSASPSVSLQPSMSIFVQDIGGGTSSAVSNGDSWSMTSKSQDVWGYSDGFGFIQERVANGDVSVVVHVKNFKNSYYWSKTGIMIRESLDANSKHVSASLVYGEGPLTFWRAQTGQRSYYGGYNNLGRNVNHQWLKLIKRGNSFYAYAGFEDSDHEDGIKWTQMGNSIVVNMSSGTNLHVGMFLSSNKNGPASADFTDYLASQTASPTAVPTTSAAPTESLVKKVIVCGRRGNCAEGNEKVVSTETEHEVRCCSDTEIPGGVKTAGCNVWGGSVCVKKTFYLAVKTCEGIGARICTKDELSAGCTGYSGCGYDAQLNWSSETVSHSKVLVKYYSGFWSKLPDFEKLQPPFLSEYVKDINFSTGKMRAGKADRFGALYEGRMQFPQPGTWQLCTTSDDGSALYINGMLTVNNDGLHDMETRCGSFDAADKQIVQVRAEFFEATGAEGMIVSWKSPGGTRVAIPEGAWVGQ